jgi:hypothetical protein
MMHPAERDPLQPKMIVIQPDDSQHDNISRENRFWTDLISKLGPAFCASVCLSIFSLPYLVVPAVKGPGKEFCEGYWQNQSNAQFGGMVKISIVNTRSMLRFVSRS